MIDKSQQLDYERIRILYAAMTRIFVGGALLLLFLAFIIREHMDTGLVVFWATFTFLLYFPRLFTTWLFNKNIQNGKITPLNVLVWEKYWILTTIPLLGSFSSLVFYPLGSTQLHIVATFLVILASGSILSYATSIKSILASFTVIYVPLVVKYFSIGDVDSIILGIFYILLVIVFFTYASSLNHTLIENIQLKIDNENNALKDPLTQLWNRRGLYLHLEKIIPRVARNKQALGVILLDVDHFKKYNDTHGHTAGDDILVKVAECIAHEAREEDLIVRYGGEEFLIVIPDTSVEHLKQISARLLTSVQESTDVTISAGISIENTQIDIEHLINVADEALYTAKRTGRNRYVFTNH